MSNNYGLSSVRRFCENSEFCEDSGFCYVPQKSVNFLTLAGNQLGRVKKVSLGLQFKSVRFFYSPCICGPWVFQTCEQSLCTKLGGGGLPLWPCLLLDSSLLSSDCDCSRFCPLVLHTTKSGFL